ncbi:FtsB family cell division protein [Denitrobaculum tricleocarpae]|uniref:Septum formation initiator family protein n=1 Tax=Denitrobaculum tricleocarpae TaxID=2591009 RepID=A0A545TPQ4_9PROT|nr:septum formation initiator family protein [Denitrobaculum tricleocarpae]TQV79168.1 septum formation initiator family protein [Denitrobaculum tricleocarpae]
MTIAWEIRSRARFILPRVLAVCTVVYFAYHTLEGDRGFLTWLSLKQDLAQTHIAQGELRAQRQELEARVSLLRPDNLDPDLLEERARDVLNYGHENELILITPQRENSIKK